MSLADELALKSYGSSLATVTPDSSEFLFPDNFLLAKEFYLGGEDGLLGLPKLGEGSNLKGGVALGLTLSCCYSLIWTLKSFEPKQGEEFSSSLSLSKFFSFFVCTLNLGIVSSYYYLFYDLEDMAEDEGVELYYLITSFDWEGDDFNYGGVFWLSDYKGTGCLFLNLSLSILESIIDFSNYYFWSNALFIWISYNLFTLSLINLVINSFSFLRATASSYSYLTYFSIISNSVEYYYFNSFSCLSLSS